MFKPVLYKYKCVKSLAVFIIMSHSVLTYGQHGALDPSFGADGKVTTDIENNDYSYDMAIQDDGKIVLVGVVNNGPESEFGIVRYNSNGSIDSSFGTNGVVTEFWGWGHARGVAIHSDGKIVVAGMDGPDIAILRLNHDGTLDTSFNGYGKTTIRLGTWDWCYDVALQKNGKIIISGSTQTSHYADLYLIRYNIDGSIDSNFNTGIVTSSFGNIVEGKQIIILENGQILLAGESWTNSREFGILRFTEDGKHDATFGNNGLASIDIDIGSTEELRSMTLQSDGKIVVAGYSFNGSDNDFALARFNSNGVIDNTFGVNGKVTTAIGSENDEGRSIEIQPDGKIIVAGFMRPGSSFNFALVRYNENGTPDTTFGIDGVITTTFGNTADRAYSIAIQLDGKILAAGHAEGDFAVARYLSGLSIPIGMLDFSINNQLALIYPNPIHSQATLEYSLSQEERISIRLMDISGKVIKTFVDQQSRSEGMHSEEMDFPNVAAGNYLLVIYNGQGSQSIKIIIH